MKVKPVSNNKCPYDSEDPRRKYFILAGGRIELQNKGGGSSARIMAKTGDAQKGYVRYNINMLSYDNSMEIMANAMHNAIADHVADEIETRDIQIQKLIEEVELLKGKLNKKYGSKSFGSQSELLEDKKP